MINSDVYVEIQGIWTEWTCGYRSDSSALRCLLEVDGKYEHNVVSLLARQALVKELVFYTRRLPR